METVDKKELRRIKQREAHKRWKLNNPEKYKASCKKYNEKNCIKRREAAKQWRLNNPERYEASRKKYYEKNREKLLAYMKAYRDEHKAEIFNKKNKEVMKTDPDYAYRRVMSYIDYLDKLDDPNYF